MAEIILPPEEETPETPQAPELNIDKPTENSKVITIEFEAKKTNKVSTKDTNQQLYTTDTDAWFEFKETSLEGANGTYSVVFRNRHDGSIFQRTGDVVGGVAYYKIPHQEIRHAGAWRGQVVYTLSNGDTTAREFDYDVKGHILDGKDVREIVVEDFETLMSQLRSMKDDAELELADLTQELENLIDTANQNEINETNRQVNELARESAESVRVSNEEERKLNEAERIESEVARKEEMEKARYSRFSNHTYDEIGERLDTIESATFTSHVFDNSGAPGPKSLIRGGDEAGFFGFVQPEEMGELLGNPEGNQEFNGANLALAVGLAQGTSFNNDTPWMKFISNGEIMFVPVKPIRHTLSWNSIYNAGAVYGDNTNGVNPLDGRAGNKLSVDGPSNSFMIEPDSADRGFLMPSAVTAAVGDTVVARGFANANNNGEFEVTSINDTQIFVDGDLTTEAQGRNSASIYEKSKAVRQDATVTIGDNKYKVRLLRGASQDPLNSYADADRDMVGPLSEWNGLILPMHEKAKLGDWAYKAYAGDVEDWGIGLTDKDLVTHHTLGLGSYSWMQETSDVDSFHRVHRGGYGASVGNLYDSWYVYAARGWRPALHLSV